jgi:hypothetical protein
MLFRDLIHLKCAHYCNLHAPAGETPNAAYF